MERITFEINGENSINSVDSITISISRSISGSGGGSSSSSSNISSSGGSSSSSSNNSNS